MKTLILSATGVGAATVIGKAIGSGVWEMSSFLAGAVVGGILGALLLVFDRVVVGRR